MLKWVNWYSNDLAFSSRVHQTIFWTMFSSTAVFHRPLKCTTPKKPKSVPPFLSCETKCHKRLVTNPKQARRSPLVWARLLGPRRPFILRIKRIMRIWHKLNVALAHLICRHAIIFLSWISMWTLDGSSPVGSWGRIHDGLLHGESRSPSPAQESSS